MKKLFFVVVFALVGFSCFAQENVEGRHSYYSSCNAYAGKRYILAVVTGITLKEAEAKVDGLVPVMRKEGNKITFVDKPFKNEVKTALEAVKNHYEPEKGDFYLVMTVMSYTTGRLVFIWMESNNGYRYWVCEQ